MEVHTSSDSCWKLFQVVVSNFWDIPEEIHVSGVGHETMTSRPCFRILVSSCLGVGKVLVIRILKGC